MRDWQTTETSPRHSSEPWKEYLGEACPHGLEIVLVDGRHVRDAHDSDFSQGGNGFRYDFVPRDEIWVDACIDEDERPLVVFHECVESELMRRGQSYSRAHDRAKMLEDRLRHEGDLMPKKTRRSSPSKAFLEGLNDGLHWTDETNPSRATVEGLLHQPVLPSESLINALSSFQLATCLGINTRQIWKRTSKFYQALEDYDRGFQRGALNVLNAMKGN